MTEGPSLYVEEDTIVAKNLLGNMTCDNCTYATVRDDADEGYQLHCKNENFLKDPHVKWVSHVVPKERTCKNWNGVCAT